MTTSKYEVKEVLFGVHTKCGASEDAPKSMRVDYRVGFVTTKSEWVCFEHEGFARQKAVAWWKRRSREPVPETAEDAVELAQRGCSAPTHALTVRSVAGEQFDQIVGYELGDIPTAVAQPMYEPQEELFPFGYNVVTTEEGIPW